MTLLLYDDIYLKHDTGAHHPENYKRLENTVGHLKTTGLWDRCTMAKPRAATVEEIALVHDRDYIDQAREVAGRGGGQLDPDTTLSRDSYQAALYAAGALLTAADAIIENKSRNAFCMVRPPGHHAMPARGMGFCVFNNVAIAAQYLISRHKLGRVVIIDWDCHHGNGTQEIFYGDDHILYLSLHRWPFYPGTGAANETGSGRGEGFTINIPVSGDTPPAEYRRLFTDVMNGRVSDFRPEFIIISAGFDGYAGDPIAGLGLKPEDFAALTRTTMDVAHSCCGDRILSCLEGGYDLQGLALCAEQHLKTLLEAE
ncbi:MAG: histone deacetylase [Candidatus Brocadiales bacterium]